MLRQFQFTLRDLFWAVTSFAVLLSASLLLVRTSGLKMAGVWFIFGVVLFLPAVVWRLAQPAGPKRSAPVISLWIIVIVAAIVGIFLPFFVAFLLRLFMSQLRSL